MFFTSGDSIYTCKHSAKHFKVNKEYPIHILKKHISKHSLNNPVPKTTRERAVKKLIMKFSSYE